MKTRTESTSICFGHIYIFHTFREWQANSKHHSKHYLRILLKSVEEKRKDPLIIVKQSIYTNLYLVFQPLMFKFQLIHALFVVIILYIIEYFKYLQAEAD